MTRVVRFHRTGGPEVMQFDDLPVGDPRPGEMRVRVEAIGLNRAEAMFRSGAYLETPRLPARLGYEASAKVESLGDGVHGFAPGDLVSVIPAFSMNDYGVYAETAIVPAYGVVRRPNGLSAVESAALWMAYLTAWGALIDIGHLGEGDAVVIPAASSSVGLGGGAWGLERSTVEPKDLLSLRVPDLRKVDAATLRLIADAEAAVAREATSEHLQALDASVAELYEFDRHELVLARESVERARMLIFEGRKRRWAFVKPPQREPLQAYAATVTSVVNGYLRSRGTRHLEAAVYSRPLVSASWADGGGGLTAVRFRMGVGAPPREPAIALGEDAELVALADQLKGWMKSDLPPYLNERRYLRLYLGDSLFILKPSEVRYWTKTAGLNDADVILADHWLKASHAAYA